MNYFQEILAAQFLRPAVFWLFVPLLVLYPVILWKRGRRGLTDLVRLLAFSLLITALADPIKRSTTAKQELLALLDVSSSVSSKARSALLETLQPFLGDRDLAIKVVPFAAKPAAQSLLLSRDRPDIDEGALDRIAQGTDTGDTNISAAINMALARSQSSSVLLLSDGFETSGNARQAARSVVDKGLKIYPLVPGEEAFKEDALSISTVHAPLTVNAGDIAEIRASVKNGFPRTAKATLEIWLDKEKLSSQDVIVPGGEEKLVTLKTPAVEGGLHRIRTVLTPQGGNGSIEKHRWVSAKERSKILLVSGTADDARVLRRLIGLKGYALEDIVADGNKEIPVKFDSYSSVILNNAAMRQLPREFLPALKEFVSAGGGLLMVGGDRSFGLGGYIDTPLEEISPLKFVPPQTTKRRLNNAVILVIDKSRSMVYENKIEGAKSAALSSIESLKDDDYVGVIGFDSTPFVIIRLDRVPEVKPIAERRLRNLTASGKTHLLPALAAARQSLHESDASRKHIIVLSDGKMPVTGGEYEDEIRRLRHDGITLSTVALGVEADVPFMQMLSQTGGGAFYHTLDASRLPEIFIHDIKVTTGEKSMQENQDFPIGVGPSGVISTSLNRFPPLRGFVETLPKRGSELELITRKGEDPFPILGSWNFNRGTVITFTSDANGRWSLPWLDWGEFARFWGELIEKIKGKGDTSAGEVDFDLRYSVSSGAVNLDLAIYDEKLRTEVSPRIMAEVIQPGGEVEQIVFTPNKKGRFTGTIPHGRPGDYRLGISYGNIKFPPLALTLSGESFGEVPGRGLSVQALVDVAYLSGGMINPEPNQVETFSRVTENDEHLFVPLVITAFLLVMLEAFLRELGVTRLFSTLLFGGKKQSNNKQHQGIYQSKRRAA